MYLYFFDLDDTICDTKSLVNDIVNQHQLDADNFATQMDFYNKIEEFLYQKNFADNKLLHNSTTLLLKELIKKQPDNVYYITARESKVRDVSIKWLKEHNLYLGDKKLIMDTKGIKGKVINDILQKSPQDFAFLFDDLIDNHLEASKYKNIISCYPH